MRHVQPLADLLVGPPRGASSDLELLWGEHVLQRADGFRRPVWNTAAAYADEGRRYAQDTGQTIWDTWTMNLAAILAGARGDNDRAQALAAKAEQQASSIPAARSSMRACSAQGCAPISSSVVHAARSREWDSAARRCRRSQLVKKMPKTFDEITGTTGRAQRPTSRGRRNPTISAEIVRHDLDIVHHPAVVRRQ